MTEWYCRWAAVSKAQAESCGAPPRVASNRPASRIILLGRALPQHVHDHPLAVVLGELEIVDAPPRHDLGRRGLVVHFPDRDFARRRGGRRPAALLEVPHV